jgi:hypothetical protein
LIGIRGHERRFDANSDANARRHLIVRPMKVTERLTSLSAIEIRHAWRLLVAVIIWSS